MQFGPKTDTERPTTIGTVAVSCKFVPQSFMVRVKSSLPCVELVSVNLLNAVLIADNLPVSVNEVEFRPAMVNPSTAVVFNKPWVSLTTTLNSDEPAPLSVIVRPFITVGWLYKT